MDWSDGWINALVVWDGSLVENGLDIIIPMSLGFIISFLWAWATKADRGLSQLSVIGCFEARRSEPSLHVYLCPHYFLYLPPLGARSSVRSRPAKQQLFPGHIQGSRQTNSTARGFQKVGAMRDLPPDPRRHSRLTASWVETTRTRAPNIMAGVKSQAFCHAAIWRYTYILEKETGTTAGSGAAATCQSDRGNPRRQHRLTTGCISIQNGWRQTLQEEEPLSSDFDLGLKQHLHLPRLKRA